MSTHVNLVDMRIGSGGVSAPSTTFTVRGVMYTMPLPAHQINGSTVVFPMIEPGEEANSIRVRFDRWQIGRDVGPWRQLPLVCPDMAAATRVAMEFGSDPGISWNSSEEDLGAWAMAFIEREQARAGGDR